MVTLILQVDYPVRQVASHALPRLVHESTVVGFLELPFHTCSSIVRNPPCASITSCDMSTFHFFPRLPQDLRVQIWQLATTPRILKLNLNPDYYGRHNRSRIQGYWSPTLPPAMIQVSQEARKYSSYHKAFISNDSSPRYIWTDFTHDILQIRPYLISELLDTTERDAIQHIRIDLMNDYKGYEAEFFFHNHSHEIRDFPSLQRVDTIVEGGLHGWTKLILENYWGTCPMANVRIVDGKTGEWICEDTCGVYADWLDNRAVLDRENGDIADIWFTRVVDDEDGEDKEEIFEQRVEAVKRFKGLPRMDLDC